MNTKFKEQLNTIYVIQRKLMSKRSACPDSRATASCEGGRVIKMLDGLPDSAAGMPLSAEQARSCQLFLGKNRFCQP